MKKLLWAIGLFGLMMPAILVTSCSSDDGTTSEIEKPVSGRFVTSVVVPFDLDAYAGMEYALTGNGFAAGDVLKFEGETTYTAETVEALTTKLTFRIPDMTSGSYRWVLHRGNATQNLGTCNMTMVVNVPDKEGMNIKGYVSCDGAGVPGVLVSDGFEWAETDANGCYWLNSAKKHGYVFIIQPSGYEVPVVDALPQFWHELSGDASMVEERNFTLSKVDDTNFTLLMGTDMHLANRNTPKDYQQFRDGFVKEVVALYNNGARGKVHMLNLGDFAWDQYWYENKWTFPECKKEIAAFDFHYWSTMGNHDNDPYEPLDYPAEQRYRDEMGPVYYSFNVGNVHIIMLDNTVYTNVGASQGVIGTRAYNKYVTDDQLNWLREDLKHVDKSTPIFVGMHCQVYTYGWSNNALTVNAALTNQTHINNLLACFEGYQDVSLVTGHSHQNRNIISPATPAEKFTEARIREHNIAAVCGTWWWTQRYVGNNVCTEGSPAGYKVFKIQGSNIEWYYKGLGIDDNTDLFTAYDMNKVKEYWKSDDTQMQKFLTKLPARASDYNSIGDNVVMVNVWAHEQGWKISVKEDGKELDVKQVWIRDPLHSLSYDIPRSAAGSDLTFASGNCHHMFAATASSATSTVEISVTDNFGHTWTETMTRPMEFKVTY